MDRVEGCHRRGTGGVSEGETFVACGRNELRPTGFAYAAPAPNRA